MTSPLNGYRLASKVDAEAQAHLRAIAAQNRIDRENALQRQYAHNARRSGQVYNAMPVADGSQEYLVNKGVKAFPGVKADKKTGWLFHWSTKKAKFVPCNVSAPMGSSR